MSAAILVVEDQAPARNSVSAWLRDQGYEVHEAETLSQANQFVDRNEADIVLLDVELPDGYGLSLLERVTRDQLALQVIVLTGYGDIDMAVEAMQGGACDFIPKPFRFERLHQGIERAMNSIRLRRELERHRSAQQNLGHYLFGETPYMKQPAADLARVAQSDASVLITGDNGTGKEGLARAIHEASRRADKFYLPVNCADFPEHLIESELFGHEPNAFSGAGNKRKDGVFVAADGGTLFLDEIGNLRMDLQSHLLRALESRSIRRVGSNNWTKIDTRIIAATNRDLKTLVAGREFREDLYHRLHVVELRLPPLRERAVDIPILAAHFLKLFNREFGRSVVDISRQAMGALCAHDWPGNIRELRNAIQRAFIYCDGDRLELRHFPTEVAKAYEFARLPADPPAHQTAHT